MKKLFACLAIAFLAMSFKTVAPTIYHYPSFMMAMSNTFPNNGGNGNSVKPFPVALVTEGYCNGVFVSDCNDYLQGIDSIATKHDQWVRNDSPKGSYVVYDNFYSRYGAGKWKKYDSKKRLIGIISEIRTDTIPYNYKTDQWSIVYYTVK